jgi:Gas vesicle synthesis protein GvpL/GvpF
VIYVYAITDRPGTPLPDRALREVGRDDLAVVFAGDGPGAEPAADVLWAHEDVVEKLMRSRTVLPMRFGTQLRDEEAARALLSDRYAEFARRIEAVRGRVELGVRVSGRSPAPAPAGPPASGTEYMTQRLGARRESDNVAATVHEPLARIADRSSRSRSARAGEVLTASYLLPNDRVSVFADEVKQLQERHPELALTCTGPWPPYSFVEEEA